MRAEEGDFYGSRPAPDEAGWAGGDAGGDCGGVVASVAVKLAETKSTH